MTTNPITPQPALVEQCMEMFSDTLPEAILQFMYQAGADAELEACCEWLDEGGYNIVSAGALRRARRPNTPSLKQQALAILDDCSDRLDGAHENIIRRALEQLNDQQR